MPFLITTLAGFSTLIGYFFIYLKNKNNRVLISSLGFASGVMFFISIFDLIPESIKILSQYYYVFFSLILCVLFLVIGIMLSSIIDSKLPNNGLYKTGIISMIAITLHNIPEGIVTYLTSSIDIKLGISIGIAIALHNIPEGISISIPIYYSTNSRIKAFIYTFITGISELFGSLIAYLFFNNIDNYITIGSLYSFTAGIMFYISLVDLLPTSIKYGNKKITSLSFIFGLIFFYLVSLLLK